LKQQVLKFDFKQQLDKPNTLDLFIYSVVSPDSYNWWTQEEIKSETSADFFRKQLEQYKDVEYINLYVNSAGGSVKEGYGIFAQLERHDAYKTVYVDGFAHSICAFIAMCGDKIIMYVNSVMGIHNMMDGCWGNADEHRQCADNLDRMMEGNRQVMLNRSKGKISEDKLIELLRKESILTADECLQYGFCDEIAETAADPEQVMQMMTEINMTMQSQIKYFGSLKQTFKEAMTASAAHITKEPKPGITEPTGTEANQTDPKDPTLKKTTVNDPEGEPEGDPPPESVQVKDFFMGLFN